MIFGGNIPDNICNKTIYNMWCWCYFKF